MKLVAMLACTLILPAANVLAATRDKVPESWMRLTFEMKALYGERSTLTQKWVGRKRRVEFCPDNTCLRVTSPPSTSFNVLSDFFYLFGFFAAPYHEQEQKWKPRKEVADYSLLLLEQYRTDASCVAGEIQDVARCVLVHLESSQGIKVFVVRYDEGKKVASRARVVDFFQQNKHGGNK